MNRRTIVLLILTLALQASPQPALAQDQKNDFSELGRLALEELKTTNTPGAVIAVVSGDKVVYIKAFGVSNIESGTPMTSEMLFQLGSLTKTFTATALVALAEEGKIKLDEPIGNYVKGLPAAISRITSHQLLSHTSGLRDQPDEYGPHDDSALAAFVHSWKEDDYVLIEPGKAFSYSNPAFALAGYVVEEVSGKPFADHMNDGLFKWLGMSNTTLRPTLAMTYPFTMGHKATPNAKPFVVRPMADDSRQWPAGGMYSNPSELARFAIAFMNEGRLDGKQVLSPSLIKKMATAYTEIPGLSGLAGPLEKQSYGYGLFLFDHRGVRVVEHPGTMPGFAVTLRMVPEKRFAVIALSNQERGFLKNTVEKAMEIMLPLKPLAQAPPVEPLPMTASQMNDYVGTYCQPERMTVEILTRDGKLFIKQAAGELPLIKIGAQRFSFIPPGAPQPLEILFGLGADGKPEYLQMIYWVLKKRLKK